jgi:hypothetical protein
MQKIETITIDKSQSIALTIQMVFLFFIGGAIFTYVGGASEGYGSIGWLGLLVYILTIISHELLHGLGFMLAGAKPKFGIAILGIMPAAYATAKGKISIRQTLIVLHLPLLVLSVFFLAAVRIFPQHQALFLIGFIGNFAGAVGDLWISSRIWKYLPFKDAYVIDGVEGTSVYSDDKKAIETGRKSQVKTQKPNKIYSVFIIVFSVILIIQLFGSMLVSWFGINETFQLGFEHFFLFETASSSSAITSTLNFSTTLITTLMICGLYYLINKAITKQSLNN